MPESKTAEAWLEEVKKVAMGYAIPIAGKVVGAILLWIVGRWIISGIRSVTRKALGARKLDQTLVRYLDSVLGVLLTIVLVVGILSVFGVETTSVAGLLAAAGVAIGMAWSGLLSNFAAGVFMIMLQPFKVGDMVTAAGITGVIHEIGLFATVIDTPDNVRHFVGNAKIFGDTITNFNTNAHRGVELRAQVVAGVDVDEAIKLLKDKISKIPNVKKDPAPVIDILQFTAVGPMLVVRPFCHNDHYWQVYFDTNRAIYQVFGDAGYPAAPEQRIVMRQQAAAS